MTLPPPPPPAPGPRPLQVLLLPNDPQLYYPYEWTPLYSGCPVPYSSTQPRLGGGWVEAVGYNAVLAEKVGEGGCEKELYVCSASMEKVFWLLSRHAQVILYDVWRPWERLSKDMPERSLASPPRLHAAGAPRGPRQRPHRVRAPHRPRVPGRGTCAESHGPQPAGLHVC